MGTSAVRIDAVGPVHRSLGVGVNATWIWEFHAGFLDTFSRK
jgi:hypothetical protein